MTSSVPIFKYYSVCLALTVDTTVNSVFLVGKLKLMNDLLLGSSYTTGIFATYNSRKQRRKLHSFLFNIQ